MINKNQYKNKLNKVIAPGHIIKERHKMINLQQVIQDLNKNSQIIVRIKKWNKNYKIQFISNSIYKKQTNKNGIHNSNNIKESTIKINKNVLSNNINKRKKRRSLN